MGIFTFIIEYCPPDKVAKIFPSLKSIPGTKHPDTP